MVVSATIVELPLDRARRSSVLVTVASTVTIGVVALIDHTIIAALIGGVSLTANTLLTFFLMSSRHPRRRRRKRRRDREDDEE
jgi:hypothetical protein